MVLCRTGICTTRFDPDYSRLREHFVQSIALKTVLIVSACFGPVFAEDTNLLSNPGFEETLPDHWVQRTPTDESRTLSWEGQQCHSGLRSAKIENHADVLSRWRQGHERTIKVPPDAQLKYESWVKTEMSGPGHAFLRLFFMSSEFKEVGVRTSQRVMDTTEWRRLVTYTTVPENTAFVMAYVELRGKGVAYFDDMSLQVIERPETPTPKNILLVTDLPEDTPAMTGITHTAGARLRAALTPEVFAQDAVPDGVETVVLFAQGLKNSAKVFSVLESFAERGGTVVMELANFAALRELELQRRPFNDVPSFRGTFDGPASEYDIVVSCADKRTWVSDMYFFVNDRLAGHWLLDAAVTEEEGTRIVTKTVAGQTLKPGDTFAIFASTSGSENCAVDKIEFHGVDGTQKIVIEAETLEGTNSYVVSSDRWIRPFDKGMRVRLSGLRTETIQITAETSVTRGFAKGNTLYWHGGAVRQSVSDVSKLSDATVLAQWDDGGAVMIEQRLGQGRLVALDLAGPPEPYWGRKGGINKYAFLGNVLGPGIRFGRHFAKKLPYGEFVEQMRTFADSAEGVTLMDEGPGSDDRRIWSLNFGDPKKPMFFISAATHGGEWEPGYGLFCLAQYLAKHGDEGLIERDRYSLKILPILSPWAYDKIRRHTPDGVDPNRNSDFYWSEYSDYRTNKEGIYGPHAYAWKGDGPFCLPETQAYKKIIDSNPIHCVVEFHCPAWFISMPVTARPKNIDLAERARWLASQELGKRCVFQRPRSPRIDHYSLGPLTWMARTPFLIQYGARGRYGMLVELPGTFSSDTSATLTLTEIAATTAWAAIQAFAEE